MLDGSVWLWATAITQVPIRPIVVYAVYTSHPSYPSYPSHVILPIAGRKAVNGNPGGDFPASGGVRAGFGQLEKLVAAVVIAERGNYSI